MQLVPRSGPGLIYHTPSSVPLHLFKQMQQSVPSRLHALQRFHSAVSIGTRIAQQGFQKKKILVNSALAVHDSNAKDWRDWQIVLLSHVILIAIRLCTRRLTALRQSNPTSLVHFTCLNCTTHVATCPLSDHSAMLFCRAFNLHQDSASQ